MYGRLVTMRNSGLAVVLAVMAILAPAPGAAAMDEAERQAKLAQLERIQKEMMAVYDRETRSYVDEHGSGKRDVALVVGTLYEMGRIGEPDPVRAAKYYAEAAELGSSDAACALGMIYYNGAESDSGAIPRDPAAAMKHFESAAEDGSVRAMVELGLIYADGKNVDPDSKKALEYFREAAAYADATALDRLKPVMAKAKQWEEAKPGRKGKAGFPTHQDEIIDKVKVQRFIDHNFMLQQLASSTYVELSKRFAAATKKIMN